MPPRLIHEAAAAVRAGTLTPLDLLDECLARIDRYEERVRAWVFVDRDRAREDAARLTDELRRGHNRGPLHGVPVGVKDIIDVADWPTAAGSKRWANSIAREDATCVARLRQAGAVILGKTVTTAFAFLDPPVTRNPWDLSRTPGGSSSGSAAAVACGMCLAALGTQTGGSLTRPAAYCGVCALKPTHGRVSTHGVVPLAPSLDHVGVIAGCVRDLAVVFQAIAGHDPTDPNGAQPPVPDAARSVTLRVGDKSGKHAFRLSALHGLFRERAKPLCWDRLTHFQQDVRTTEGVESAFAAVPSEFADVLPLHRRVMAVQAAAYHRERFRRHPDDYPPRISSLISDGLACQAVDYDTALAERARAAERIDGLFHDGTFLLTPAATGPAAAADSTGDPSMNAPWSFTGHPTVSFPVGWTHDGLPVGAQLTGPRWGEAALLAAAAVCERAGRLEFHPRDLPLA